MSFDIRVVRTPAYVRYTASGQVSLARTASLIQTIAHDVEKFEDICVLVDLRGVVGRLSTSEQISVGELAAAQLAGLYKLASLVPEGEISGNSERAATRQGMLLRVFIVESSAIRWLLDQD